MIITVNKVKDKYKTKNNKTADKPVFLAIKNQANANISSARNLRLMATRLCIAWLDGSLACPLKKIINVRKTIIVNPADTAVISLNSRPIVVFSDKKNPAKITSISSKKSDKTGFLRFFTEVIIF
jgi:hydrogenase maturation factor HypF (carbamoyltransferase family)